MKKYIILAALAAFVTGCGSVRPIGSINGLTVTKITNRGVFSPSSTTFTVHDPAHRGELNVIHSASGPGLVPAVAGAGGLVGAAVLLRPSSNNSNNTTATVGGTAITGNTTNTNTNTNPGSAPFVPHGHQDNPSQNH